MANASNIFDLEQTLAAFLATAVPGGGGPTWEDVFNALKADQDGAVPGDEIDEKVGALWGNGFDDFLQIIYPFFYKATKLWRRANLAALQAIGSNDSLSVSDLAWSEGDSTIYKVDSVDGASSSTWSQVVVAGASSSSSWGQAIYDVDYTTLSNLTLTDGTGVDIGDGSGTVWNIQNQSTATTRFEVLNGTGIEIDSDTSNKIFTLSSRTSGFLSALISDLVADHSDADDLRLWFYFDEDAVSNGDGVAMGIGYPLSDSLGRDHVSFRGFSIGGTATSDWFYRAGNTTFSDQSVTNTPATDDVVVVQYNRGGSCAIYTGKWVGPDWPDIEDLKMRYDSPSGNTRPFNNLYYQDDLTAVFMGLTSTSSASFTGTFKRMRIDRRR